MTKRKRTKRSKRTMKTKKIKRGKRKKKRKGYKKKDKLSLGENEPLNYWGCEYATIYKT